MQLWLQECQMKNCVKSCFRVNNSASANTCHHRRATLSEENSCSIISQPAQVKRYKKGFCLRSCFPFWLFDSRVEGTKSSFAAENLPASARTLQGRDSNQVFYPGSSFGLHGKTHPYVISSRNQFFKLELLQN